MKDKRRLIIFLTVFIDLIGFGMIIPLNPYLARAYGATALEVGLLMSVYSFMQFVFAPVWGQLSDRIGRRPVILVSLLGAAVAHSAFAFAPTLGALFLARGFAGVFGGNISTAMAYIADITEDKDRSKGMGLIGAAFGLGFVLGPFMGGAFGRVGLMLGPEAPFGEAFSALIAGGICLLNFLFALKFLPESLQRPSAPIARPSRFLRIASALTTPTLGTLMILVFLNTVAMALIEAPLFLIVQEKFAWTFTQASFGFAYIGVVLVFTQGYLIRKIMPKYGERVLLLLGLAATAIGFHAIAFAEDVWIMAAAVTVLGLGNGLVNPSLNGSVSLASAKDVQGGNLGVAQSLSSLARIVGPAAGGAIYQKAPWLTFTAAGFLVSVALVTAFVIRARLPQTGKVAH